MLHAFAYWPSACPFTCNDSRHAQPLLYKWSQTVKPPRLGFLPVRILLQVPSHHLLYGSVRRCGLFLEALQLQVHIDHLVSLPIG